MLRRRKIKHGIFWEDPLPLPSLATITLILSFSPVPEPWPSSTVISWSSDKRTEATVREEEEVGRRSGESDYESTGSWGVSCVLRGPSSFLRGPNPHLWKEAEASQAAHDAVNFRETLSFATRLFGEKYRKLWVLPTSGKERTQRFLSAVVCQMFSCTIQLLCMQ